MGINNARDNLNLFLNQAQNYIEEIKKDPSGQMGHAINNLSVYFNTVKSFIDIEKQLGDLMTETSEVNLQNIDKMKHTVETLEERVKALQEGTQKIAAKHQKASRLAGAINNIGKHALIGCEKMEELLSRIQSIHPLMSVFQSALKIEEAENRGDEATSLQEQIEILKEVGDQIYKQGLKETDTERKWLIAFIKRSTGSSDSVRGLTKALHYVYEKGLFKKLPEEMRLSLKGTLEAIKSKDQIVDKTTDFIRDPKKGILKELENSEIELSRLINRILQELA